MCTDVVAKTASYLFGCQGLATQLPGECDQNFHINTADGIEFLLKISHHTEQRSIIDLQNEVLIKLQTAQLPFHTPAPQRTITGEWVGHFSSLRGTKQYGSSLLLSTRKTICKRTTPCAATAGKFRKSNGTFESNLKRY